MKRSKRYLEVKEKVRRDREYPLEEALRLVKETATAGFDETVEMHVRLGVDPVSYTHLTLPTKA